MMRWIVGRDMLTHGGGIIIIIIIIVIVISFCEACGGGALRRE